MVKNVSQAQDYGRQAGNGVPALCWQSAKNLSSASVRLGRLHVMNVYLGLLLASRMARTKPTGLQGVKFSGFGFMRWKPGTWTVNNY